MAISNSLQFYLDRAQQARTEAEKASLFHVRERCRRAEAAWSSLANKAARAQEGRLQQERKTASSLANDDAKINPIKISGRSAGMSAGKSGGQAVDIRA